MDPAVEQLLRERAAAGVQTPGAAPPGTARTPARAAPAHPGPLRGDQPGAPACHACGVGRRARSADRPLMLLAQEDQGRIVGGALAFRTDPAVPAGGVTLRLLGVAPAQRGKCLGRRLLQQVEAAAVRLGAGEISLRQRPGARVLPAHGLRRPGAAAQATPPVQHLHLPAKQRRRDLAELRRRRRRLAARQS
jgi:GNAT superfamily N-acetyltransferase